MTKGEMGSTFPLLEMEATMFSRIGVTAEIFATGCRPLTLIRMSASTVAASRKISIRFRNRRSICRCLLLRALRAATHEHTRAAWQFVPDAWLAGPPSGGPQRGRL